MSRSHGSEGSSDSLLDRSIDSEEGLDDRPSSPAEAGKLKRKKGGSKKGSGKALLGGVLCSRPKIDLLLPACEVIYDSFLELFFHAP